MAILDNQVDYWNTIGQTKQFGHPVNVDRLSDMISPESTILDLGCGYGRTLEILFEHGYRNLIGFDSAPVMIAEASKRVPDARLAIAEAAQLPLPDDSVDAALLFAVLTCVPSDAGQRAIVREIDRVVCPGGLVYVSDLWLQQDERNQRRYELYHVKYGRYGVFELDEGAILRHHDTEWIAELMGAFSRIALDEPVVETMNGHKARAFQWFGRTLAV